METVCRVCGGSYHKITDNYDHEKIANGSMFVLKQKYREWGWSTFPNDTSAVGEALVCPNCDGMYCNLSGKVEVRDDPPLVVAPEHIGISNIGMFRKLHSTDVWKGTNCGCVKYKSEFYPTEPGTCKACQSAARKLKLELKKEQEQENA